MIRTFVSLASAVAVLALVGCPAGGDDDVEGGEECRTADDCRLVHDCCHCDAIPSDDTPPPCDVDDCLVDECMGWFGTGDVIVVCDLGACDVQPR